MNNSHPISDEVLELATMALFKGEHWMAYNQSLYFIDKDDVQFFFSQQEANEFANDNLSDRDRFHVIQFNSISDIYREIPYTVKEEKTIVKDPNLNGLYNYEGNAFTEALIGHFGQQQLSLFNSQIKQDIMNNENFQYLSDNIKYMGFGENLKAELEKNMNEGKKEFQLFYKAEMNTKPFEATLNFRKSDSSDMYFFNGYNASMEKRNGEKVEQSFSLNKGKGITAKEAFNLLDGRAVHKDLMTKDNVPYKAWVQLDFETKDKNNNFEVKQFHENYGYDLKATLGKFAIAELNEPAKEALIQSLQKGNVQSVTFDKDGNSQKMFIQANPQYKTIDIYDPQMKLVQKDAIAQYRTMNSPNTNAVKEEKDNDKKKEMKQDIKPEKKIAEKKNDKSLLPKKREKTKKGLGVS